MSAAPSAIGPVDLLGSVLGDRYVPEPVSAALGKLLLLDRLNSLYQDVAATSHSNLAFDRLLQLLNVRVEVAPADLARIPATGAAILVANHPFGFIEGCILAAVLPRIRPDVRIMVNSVLSAFSAIADHFLFVNPFGGPEATRQNRRGVREAMEHLRGGGLLVVFPAGEVSHIDVRQRAIVDPPWNPGVAGMARLCGAPIIPAYFSGSNSAWFQLLGLLHPYARTALLPHEFLNKHSRSIELRVGSVITNERLGRCSDDYSATALMRERTYLLQHRSPDVSPTAPRSGEPLIAPVSQEQLQAEVDALPADRRLASARDLIAMVASAHEIPCALREIGRQRERTFRLAGEGTGRALDLDAFDEHYLHLFLWNPVKREIAGAYRMGLSDEIQRTHGLRGLYTSTLFRYESHFLEHLGSPALELGRSFVCPEYQKTFAPLLLLWKGIANWVARHPRYRVLFGPVSISNDYASFSRELMVAYFNGRERHGGLAKHVAARNPFRWSAPAARPTVEDVDELSTLVSDIEADGKGVPVLLRQYMRLGGKFAAFNLDRKFANAVDGLIVVDLDCTDPRILERYMGRPETAAFLSTAAR